MSKQIKELNLLVIDDDQLHAERLIELLSLYYDDVNLGFLDDKEEFIKTLRRHWDVLVFGQAYDMNLLDVIGIVQEQGVDLPIIALANDEPSTAVQTTAVQTEVSLPDTINANLIKALPSEQETQVVLSIILQASALQTRRKVADLKYILSEAEQRANILIKNSKSAVAYIDQGIHIFANEPYLKMFGYESMDELMGVPVIDLIAGGDKVKEFKQFLRHFDKGNREQVEFKFQSKRTDGSTFEAKLQVAAATYDGEPVTQIIIQQDNKAANSAELAKKLAMAERTDRLTGLENRVGFMQRANEMLEHVKQAQDHDAALIYLRIDNIGQINTSLGLSGVDTTVRHVAHLLNEFFTESYVSRFADSVFTVLVADTNEKKLEKQIESLLPKVAQMLIEVGNRTTNTTLTAGAVMIEPQSPDVETLIQRALESQNKAFIDSEQVGNTYHIYDPSQYVNSDDKALAEYLAGAFSNHHYSLLYQPIYDIQTDSSHFFEVYLRLKLSDGQMMMPNEFVDVAREHNLLEKIDRWVLINACKQLSKVRSSHPDARILVNLTAASLVDTQLPKVIEQLVRAVGGKQGSLVIQFNEQDVVSHLAVAKKQYDNLKALGCDTCIHGFGMTTKTIETLAYIHPTMVRVAHSYVKDIDKPDGLDTIKTLITSASEHKTDTLMPYIETAATMSVSWSVGARYLQGHYLQEPAVDMNVA